MKIFEVILKVHKPGFFVLEGKLEFYREPFLLGLDHSTFRAEFDIAAGEMSYDKLAVFTIQYQVKVIQWPGKMEGQVALPA